MLDQMDCTVGWHDPDWADMVERLSVASQMDKNRHIYCSEWAALESPENRLHNCRRARRYNFLADVCIFIIQTPGVTRLVVSP